MHITDQLKQNSQGGSHAFVVFKSHQMIQMQPGLKTTILDKMMKPEYIKKKKKKTQQEQEGEEEKGNGNGGKEEEKGKRKKWGSQHS